MQRTLACLLGAATLCLPAAAQALVMALNPSSHVVNPGNSFTVQVTASQVFDGLDPADEVLSFGFDVTLSDPAVAAFTGATVAAAFDDDSSSLPGADVAGSAFPGLTEGPMLLATLTFQAGEPGVVELGIAAELSDPICCSASSRFTPLVTL